ncbi:MAG: hypothetical protein DUD27_02240 [Lachnospiraceae bacterium]|nr:MAG: hypothetical protein DUD27_02240 [Lachnospiraceae bacterium]
MDKRDKVTPEQIRVYRRRKRIIQKKRQRRRRQLITAAVILAAVIVVLFTALSGIFEKRSRSDLLTLSSDGSVIFEENSTMDDAAGLKDFVNKQISSYNSKNGEGSVQLKRFARSGDHYYVRTKYKNMAVYSDFTGYDAYSGTVEGAKEAGYSFGDTSFKSTSSKASADASADAFKGQKVLIIKEWGISVKVPGEVTGTSLAENVTCDPKDGTVKIKKQSDSGTALLTYIFYK